jgi:hypothetical protein
VIIRWLPGQTITFSQLADQNINNANSASLTATATSALTVSFTSNTPSVCTISSSTVNFSTQGSCTIVASQSGSSAYQAAPTVTMTFAIGGSVAFTITASLPLVYRTAETLSINTSPIAGKATFKQGKVRIPGCIGMNVNAGNSYAVTCNWKPTLHSNVTIEVSFTPTSSSYSTSTQRLVAFVSKRSGNR